MKAKIFLSLITLCIFTSFSLKGEKQVEEPGYHADWVYNATIYEVNIRQYTKEGTFNAFEKHIPRLKELGINILWLMPVQPIGEEKRKGTLGSYYSIKNYTQTNPEFGTLDDFKQLVNAAHNAGMKVILDWAPKHTSYDADWISEHKDWYVSDSLGNAVSLYDWTDVAELNYNNAGMRKAMQDAMIFWLKETNIDGFRYEVAYEIPLDFWKPTVSELKKIKPDIFTLAEAEESAINANVFDAYYNWDTYNAMNRIARGKTNVNSLRKAIKTLLEFSDEAIPLLFTSNHDENSWRGSEYERMGNAAHTFAVLTYMLPGMPLIYSGQEVGSNRRLEFFEKDSINWNDSNNSTALYQMLNKLKKENKALFCPELGGKLEEITTSKPDKIFAIQRKVDNDKIIAIFNLSPDTVNFTIKNDNLPPKMQLSPWEYKIVE